MIETKEGIIKILAAKTNRTVEELQQVCGNINEYWLQKISNSALMCNAISELGTEALTLLKGKDNDGIGLTMTSLMIGNELEPKYLAELCEQNKIPFKDLMQLSYNDKSKLYEARTILSQFVLKGGVSITEVLSMNSIQFDYLNNLPQQAVDLILKYKPKITLKELLDIPPLAMEILAQSGIQAMLDKPVSWKIASTTPTFSQIISLDPLINNLISQAIKTGPLGKLIKYTIIPDYAAKDIRPEVYWQLSRNWSQTKDLVIENKISYADLQRLSLVDLENIAASKNQILSGEIDVATVLKRGALSANETIGTVGAAVSSAIDHLKVKYPDYNNNDTAALDAFIASLRARANDQELIKMLYPSVAESQQLKLQQSLMEYIGSIKDITDHYNNNILGLSGEKFYSLLAALSNDKAAFKAGASKDNVLDAILTAMNENMINGYIKQDGSLVLSDKSATACNAGLGEKIVMALWPVHKEVELTVTGSMALLEARGPKVMEEQIINYIQSLPDIERKALIDAFTTTAPSKASICDCTDDAIKSKMFAAIKEKVLDILVAEYSGIPKEKLTGYIDGGLEYAPFSMQKFMAPVNSAATIAVTATQQTVVIDDFQTRWDKATIDFAKAGLQGVEVSYAVLYLLNARDKNQIKDMSIENIVKGIRYAKIAEPPISISTHGDIKRCCEYAMNHPSLR